MLPIQRSSVQGYEIEDAPNLSPISALILHSYHTLDLAAKNKSMLSQVNNIMGNNKPRYATVEDAVIDMQNRTGLNKYINTIKANNNSPQKTAKLKLIAE